MNERRARRVYRAAELAEVDGGIAIQLDGKPVRTPAKASLVVPALPLAQAIAAEWNAQGERIDPNAMPMTRLASIAIDLVAPRRAEVVAAIAKYAETDLVCYRADEPPDLAERQRATWQPILDWLAERHGAPLAVTTGVVPCRQPARSLQALEAAIADHDAWALAALNLATSALGSVVLALALSGGRIDDRAAFAASALDESFEIEQWGEDAEQMKRRAALAEDVTAAARFLALLRG